MTSTRFRLIGVALFVVALSALEAYRWDGGPEDFAKITACIRGSVSFNWSIVLGLGETVLNRNWWYQAPGKVNGTQIATYIRKHFYATDDARVGFLPNAGLSLRYARPQDSGNYSVQLKIKQGKSSLIASAWRTVTLSVTDRPPATRFGAFYVTLSDAVLDDVTEDWTLQLHCGQFVDLGHPPVDVVWKIPTGLVRNSSYQDNGTFVLSVSSPYQLGIYSCQLPPSALAARCLTATSPLKAAAKLYVDEADVRFLLLETQQRELEQVNKDQANLLQHQAMQISQLNGTMADMVRVNKDQAMQLQEQGLFLNQTVSELRPLKNPAGEHQGTHEPLANRPPATRGGALRVTLSDAVLDDVTEDWTLQLHCGQFVDLGHPPVDVVWKTPSGEVRNSSYQDNGTFVLSVSSPVQGGNYSCHLPPSAPAARCLTATSPLNAAAQLYVDDKDVRLSLLEARQRKIEQVNKDQANLLEHQKSLLELVAMQIPQQNETMADMVQVNKDQAMQEQGLYLNQTAV